MKVVLDSTVLFSVFYEGDKFHDDAMKIFSQVIDKKTEANIPTLALPEVCGAIRRVTNDRGVARMVKDQLTRLVSSELILVKEMNLDRMKFATEIAIQYGLKGADSVFVSLAAELGYPLATFDEEVKRKTAGKIKIFGNPDHE